MRELSKRQLRSPELADRLCGYRETVCGLIAPGPQRLERADHDRQVLDRQAGRVEQGDLGVRRSSAVQAGADLSELGDVLTPDAPCRGRPGQLAAVACLLPLVAEEAAVTERSLDRRDLGLGLAGPVGAEQIQMLTRAKRVPRGPPARFLA